jgi:hypothetical protein
LHNHIDSRLEDLIDEQINSHAVRPNDSSAGLEVIVSKIIEEIIQSPE